MLVILDRHVLRSWDGHHIMRMIIVFEAEC